MSARPAPAPPEGYLTFINGDHVTFAGYTSRGNDRRLLAYVRGGWHPVTFVHRTYRRSVDLAYSTGEGFNEVGRQRIAPERVAAPTETLRITWDQMHSGDQLVETDIPADLLGHVTVAGRGYGADGRTPFVDVCVIARDGAREIVRRSPDTPAVVRRIQEPAR